MSTAAKQYEVEYPTSDGKPMAETEIHRDVMMDAILTLQDHDPHWYVSGNLLLYYMEGNPRKHVSPDVFVVRGIPRHKRDYFLTWLEPKGPEFIVEVTSKTTKKEDLRTKFDLYEQTLQVPEYVLFDPRAEYLRPALQGHRLVEGKYEKIEMVEGRLPSVILGLHLERDGERLRFWDPRTEAYLPTPRERAALEARRADEEHRRAEEAESELRRLRDELARLKGEQP